MSRIGVKPISLPDGVSIETNSGSATIKGPKGQLEVAIPKGIQLEENNSQITIKRKDDHIQTKAFHGLVRALIYNAVLGVTEGFSKRLELKGIGYRAQVEQNKLVLSVGFSHPVEIIVPEDLMVSVEKNQIVVSGIDKQKVGQFAAQIRSVRPPEPYKGKGIRYFDEVIKLKPGKQAVKAVGAA